MNGTNKYVLHFDKGQLPPVNGFWSLTMYDALSGGGPVFNALDPRISSAKVDLCLTIPQRCC